MVVCSNPLGIVLQEDLENVKHCTTSFIQCIYNYETGTMIGILEKLKWEYLKKSKTDGRLILLYKGLKDTACIPTHDHIPPTRYCRNHPFLVFQITITRTDIYKGRSSPIRDCNTLPDSLISAVGEVTTLVRANQNGHRAW